VARPIFASSAITACSLLWACDFSNFRVGLFWWVVCGRISASTLGCGGGGGAMASFKSAAVSSASFCRCGFAGVAGWLADAFGVWPVDWGVVPTIVELSMAELLMSELFMSVLLISGLCFSCRAVLHAVTIRAMMVAMMSHILREFIIVSLGYESFWLKKRFNNVVNVDSGNATGLEKG
jgi:hypothetical protein